ncbi:MAG: superoxide dismutase [Cyclobacteriaceae bacterium]|nr:superoxide dismutase [Cyclobacteriaceae bacterium]
MDRRKFILNSAKTSLALSFGGSFLASCASGQKEEQITVATEESGITFKQRDLGYGFDELEPYIDAETMEIHFTRHHAGYVNNLNKAIEEKDIVVQSLEELLGSVSKYPTSVRNNGGGHYNHDLFWRIMQPGGEKEPVGDLKEAIDRNFGSFDAFKEEFEKAGMSRFGSGWAWLVERNGKLLIGSTPNQDNPIMDVSDFQGLPIIGCDVWEHAYYLKYMNERNTYLSNWWDTVNWDVANQIYIEQLG